MPASSDHFSAAAEAYARYRPRYPRALFAWIASIAPARRRAWDCATGSGQAALSLAEDFAEVVATDASERLLSAAPPHPRVTYREAPAERCALPDGWADVVVVAQALHWFDLPAFYAEASRVLVPGGPLVAWCYARLEVDPGIDAVIEELYSGVLGAYWPAERALVEGGYHDLPFPSPELAAPALAMEERWSLPELLGYLTTWSAAQRYRTALGRDPLAAVAEPLRRAWGPAERRLVRWPLHVRAARPVIRMGEHRGGGDPGM